MKIIISREFAIFTLGFSLGTATITVFNIINDLL